MAKADADRNLLFGILALQMGFVAREALIAAMNAWVLEKEQGLGEILRRDGGLSAERHTLLEALVREHLKAHGDDPARSLAAASSAGPVCLDLDRAADEVWTASLGHAAALVRSIGDPYCTVLPSDGGLGDAGESSVGTATAFGRRFQVLRFHARGGLGQVFVARDEELRREVALKELQDRHADCPEERARFVREAEITGALEHPGIVPIYALGSYPDGRPFYAMRFIRGESFKAAIQHFHDAEVSGRDPGERERAIRMLLGRFVDVCNAMEYAHSRGVLHRDVKPDNVMLGPYGETLVVDWGLAKTIDWSGTPPDRPEESLGLAAAGDTVRTLMGSPVGTPQYMSPEQAAGRLDQLGPTSDVYSLGATLYTLLTGRAPFEGSRLDVVLRDVQRGDFPPPRRIKLAISPALEAVCLKAMALDSEDRYPSPRALADDIECLLANEPVPAQATLIAREVYERFFRPGASLGADLQRDGPPEVTVLAFGIREAGRIVRRLDPEAARAWIDDVRESLARHVEDWGGLLVDEIGGDELVAVWSDAGGEGTHAKRACSCALEMLGVIPGLDQRWSEVVGEPFAVGIGISSGTVGDRAGRSAFAAAAAGIIDRAGLAKRACAHFKTSIVVVGATRARLDASFAGRRLGKVTSVNIVEPLDLSELVPADRPDWADLRDRYEEALGEYEAREFRKAARILGALLAANPGDGPTLIMTYRSVGCIAGISPDFGPVWKLPGEVGLLR